MKIRNVALPQEYGSWSFVLEPLILSLLVAFSVNGLVFAISAFVLFLAKQPIKIVFNKSATAEFRKAAKKVLAVYLSIVALLFLYLIFNSSFILRIPFGMALLMMAVFLLLDYKGKGRELLFEMIPPLAITSMSISIVLMDNSFEYNVLAFGVLLLSRSIPTIIYINAKVKENKGKSFATMPTHIINIVFTLLIFGLIVQGLLPALTIAVPLLLLIRSVIGFSKFNFTKTVKQIGIAEFIYGAIFVVINAIAL